MKIIDLLNKIANGEEVPKKINFCRRNFEYKKDIYDYLCIDENFDKTEDYCLGISICKWIFPSMLNDEVEILEEEKETKPLTKKDIEAIGYACGEMRKCFTNGWTKSLENKPLEEEKKIPEKLKIEQDGHTYNNFYIVNQNGTKCYLTKHSKMIAETLNQVIDYLNNKGDE